MHKTSKKDFEFFVAEFKKALHKLGLNEWKVYFIHSNLKETSRANVCHDGGVWVATVRLSTRWDEKPTHNSLRSSARHEALHILTARMMFLANCRFIDSEEIRQESERLARILHRALWGDEDLFEVCVPEV